MNGVVAVRNARKVSKALAELGQRLYARGWALGTSGNFSEVVSRRPLRLAITASGHDKRTLRPSQILTVDGTARRCGRGGRPSAETLLHVTIARAVRRRRHRAHAFGSQHRAVRRARRCRRVSHPRLRDAQGPRRRGLARAPGVGADSGERPGHAAPRGGARERTLADHPAAHAVLLRRHGLYTWGATLAEAERHVEILEFLFETLVRRSRYDEGNDVREVHDGAGEDSVRRAHAGHMRMRFARTWAAAASSTRACLRPSCASDVPAEALLARLAPLIDDLKARGGYVTADVIDVSPATPGLDAMLARFNTEHWHDEDEVRLIVEGRGLFHVHPPGAAGLCDRSRGRRSDSGPARHAPLVRLCAAIGGSARFGCSRILPGWTPHYTQSGADRDFQPVCFGPAYIRPTAPPASV